MRLGRAALAWDAIACSNAQWRNAVELLRARALGCESEIALAIYPHDILREMELRLESPQAILLIVPNGKVKLLNALPFAAADLKETSIHDAWQIYRQAWRTPQVREFISACQDDPRLLQHANETWSLKGGPAWQTHAGALAHP
jgi:hypothetical protein